MDIEAIAERIRKLEMERRNIADMLRKAGLKVPAVERRLVYKVQASEIKAKILGVDGGVSQQSYHGFDMILVRSVGVIFEYEGILKRIAYYPNACPQPELKIIEFDENGVNAGIIRQKNEVDTAVGAIAEYSPDIVLMDGPIIPHSKIRRGSSGFKLFSELIDSLKRLYSSSVVLGGCVEDSKGMEACKIISKAMEEAGIRGFGSVSNTRDTVFFYNLLKRGERTFIFRRHDPVLEDLEEFGKKIYSFYIKTAEFDRPMRIDFFSKKSPIETAEKLASIMVRICPDSMYGFPIPLIEADMRAKLQENDIESVRDRLADMTGMSPSLMRLRRNVRPF